MNISVGGGRSAKLNVTGGGAVNSNGNFIDLGGVVNVDGAGSTWTAGYEIVLGQQTYGTLNISGGGAVETGSVSVSASSAIGIDVGKGNALALTDTLTNNGTIRLAAGAGASAGQPYSPITATTWTGTGTYQALGGTWNNTTHQFTVSNVLSGPAGTQLTIDLENEQRVLFSDDPSRTGWSVGASFLSSTTSKPLSVTATTIGGSTFTALQSLLGPQQSILGGWEFAFASGYTEGDPAYLSFGIGSGYSRNGLEVWHFDGSTWTPFSADDLTYDGTYASFTVTGFSGYAVTTVPEPSMLALLLAAAMGIFAYGRWKTS
jgi:T5SS/PEP-CTERM-associated repeat protein